MECSPNNSASLLLLFILNPSEISVWDKHSQTNRGDVTPGTMVTVEQNGFRREAKSDLIVPFLPPHQNRLCTVFSG